MCLGYMHFRAPHAALKQENDYNSLNMHPIITYFQDLFKFMKRHVLDIFLKQLNVFCLCNRHSSFPPFLIFTRLTWKVTLWGHPTHGIYRANLS